MDETARAAECLGAQRVEFLGYQDSGLDGAAGGRPAGAFADAPLAEAADRLARILTEEQPVALVSYDARGIYGHVAHVQVHREGLGAGPPPPGPPGRGATPHREHPPLRE